MKKKITATLNHEMTGEMGVQEIPFGSERFTGVFPKGKVFKFVKSEWYNEEGWLQVIDPDTKKEYQIPDVFFEYQDDHHPGEPKLSEIH